jgi:hypothetical protein
MAKRKKSQRLDLKNSDLKKDQNKRVIKTRI